MPKNRIAIYVRVSTEDQAVSGLGLAAQRDRCAAYVRAVGLDQDAAVEIFEDAGVSAKNTDRPALRRLVTQVPLRMISAVVVLKVDRLARSTLDVLKLVEVFDRFQVGFASVQEQLDTRTPTGRMVLTILAAVAQAEREAISERTKSAIATKLRQGFAHGYVPLGYVADRGRLVREPEEQETVAMILDLRDKGWSLRGICAQLKILGRTTKRGGTWGPQNVANVIRRAMLDEQTTSARPDPRTSHPTRAPRASTSLTSR